MNFKISSFRSISLVLLLNVMCSQAFGFGDVQIACDVDGDGDTDVFVGVPSDNEKRGAVYQYSDGSELHWSQSSEGVVGTDEPDDRFGSSLAAGDFNNDGYCDIAIGVPYEDLGSIKNAGNVTILYGSIEGLNKGLESQAWNEKTLGIKGVQEAGDHFGGELAVGDFNNDGNDDLAIGIRDENVGSRKDAGTVLVLYGSNNGLTDKDQLWSENSKGIKGVSEAYDRFGETLATGDFDNDGFADLAIGITGEDVGSIKNAGSVLVLYGSSAGLSARDQLWTENSPGIKGVAEAFDYFGETLSSGDFDGDNYADLAIGLPWENAGSKANSGTVLILYGSSKGLSDRDQLWSQDSKGIKGVVEAGDRFGSSLVTYDEDDDGFDELVIGIPYEDVGSVVDAGSVLMLYGSSRGLTSKDVEFNRSGDGDFAGAIDANARFGDSLAVLAVGGIDVALSVGEPGTSSVVSNPYSLDGVTFSGLVLRLKAPPPLEGQFIGSEVFGLRFETDSQTGTTDVDGIFLYLAGEQVRFYVGDYLLGEVDAKEIITPFDLAGIEPLTGAELTQALAANGKGLAFNKMLGIAGLLQTIDSDNNPDNGISITPEVAALFTADSLLGSDGKPLPADELSSSLVTQALLKKAINQGALSPREVRTVSQTLAHLYVSLEVGTGSKVLSQQTTLLPVAIV
jgi:hypothetical protein